jgi:hypothetical protein
MGSLVVEDDEVVLVLEDEEVVEDEVDVAVVLEADDVDAVVVVLELVVEELIVVEVRARMGSIGSCAVIGSLLHSMATLSNAHPTTLEQPTPASQVSNKNRYLRWSPLLMPEFVVKVMVRKTMSQYL